MEKTTGAEQAGLKQLPLQVQAWPGELTAQLFEHGQEPRWERRLVCSNVPQESQLPPSVNISDTNTSGTHTFTQCLAKIILFQRILTQS